MTSSVNGPADDLKDALSSFEHEAVRRLDEERGRAEVDQEAGALHLPVVVRDDDRVPELVHERQEESEGEQDRRFGRGAISSWSENCPEAATSTNAASPASATRPETRATGHQKNGRRRVPVAEADEPIGPFPLDRKGLAESFQLLPTGRGRIEPIRDELVGREGSGIEEASPVQGEDEIGHEFGVEPTASVHPLYDEITDGPRTVHLGEQLRLPDLEPIVELAVVPSEHREVVSPTEPEDLHLAPVSHPRAEIGDLEGIGETLVDIDRRHRGSRQRARERDREDRFGRFDQPSRHESPEVDRPARSDPTLPDAVHGDHDPDREEHHQDDRRHRLPPTGPVPVRRHPASRHAQTQRC